MSDPSYKALQRDLAPPWLLDPQGQAFLEAYGESKDDLVDLWLAAVKGTETFSRAACSVDRAGV